MQHLPPYWKENFRFWKLTTDGKFLLKNIIAFCAPLGKFLYPPRSCFGKCYLFHQIRGTVFSQTWVLKTERLHFPKERLFLWKAILAPPFSVCISILMLHVVYTKSCFSFWDNLMGWQLFKCFVRESWEVEHEDWKLKSNQIKGWNVIISKDRAQKSKRNRFHPILIPFLTCTAIAEE